MALKTAIVTSIVLRKEERKEESAEEGERERRRGKERKRLASYSKTLETERSKSYTQIILIPKPMFLFTTKLKFLYILN